MIENRYDSISVAGITDYNDYTGTQVQFITNDGLLVLTSTDSTLLTESTSKENLNSLVVSLCDEDDTVSNYNEMQGVDLVLEEGFWNKNLFDFSYTFNKAIIMSEDSLTLVELETWRDFKDDDKMQLTLLDGTVILTYSNNIKLLYDGQANSDSAYNYALSLIGDENKIIEYDKDTSKQLIK